MDISSSSVSLSFILQCMFLINYYELFECRIIITKSFLLFSLSLTRYGSFYVERLSRARTNLFILTVMLFQSVSLSHSFSSHIIDWNVTLLLCKDTRRMSALEPRPQQMRESWSCVYVHLHSFFNLSLTHSTHSPQKELRYWYFVKAFDLSLLSIFFSFSSSLLTAFVKANSFWSFSSSPTKNILFFS